MPDQTTKFRLGLGLGLGLNTVVYICTMQVANNENKKKHKRQQFLIRKIFKSACTNIALTSSAHLCNLATLQTIKVYNMTEKPIPFHSAS